MTRIEEPIGEKNLFLTGTAQVPATALSEKLGLSPVTKYAPGVDQEHGTISSECEECEELSEEEHKVEGSVLEEMSKLETTFDERGLKFRMIDRIGEG